jgi:hypothetical protein
MVALMTEQSPASDGATQVPEREITFKDRQIWVKMPSPEQLLVWKRTLARLQNTENWTGESVLAALERLRLIIDSTILNRVDIDWMDDEMLAGRLEMSELTQVVTQAVAAFGEDEPVNRAARRAKKAAPAKKATRKATPR